MSSRQLAGVLVTDIVGSTALRMRLGDRRAEEVRRLHERLLRRTVARFAAELVHWLGDGVLAAFPSASAAMEAGIAIQQANECANRRQRALTELAIRVGVAAGEVTWMNSDVVGTPVDEAVSLCRRACGAEILCLPSTLELIGSRLDIEVQTDPEGGMRVCWSPTPRLAQALGLPHALETDRQLPFTGRVEARSVLRRSLDAALAGRSQIVSVRGVAGIGKTRLVAEVAREAFERGAVILFGGCRPDLRMSNAPVAQAFRGWLAAAEDASTRLGGGAGELVRLVPELSKRAPGLDPPTESDAETERLRLYDAVAEWLVETSLDEPIVLVLDCMHWGETDTIRLLHHVIPMLERSRLMLIMTMRPGNERADELTSYAREKLGPSAVAAVELAGLELIEIHELLSQLEGDQILREDVQLLNSITRGNPLHLHEILRWRGPDTSLSSLPSTIQAAVRLHLERLGERQRRVVESAAVLGPEFEARCLAEMTADVDMTLDALDAAADAGLLLPIERSTLRYRFAHDVTRQTVLASIGTGRMARLHERAGLAMEAMGHTEQMLADLARHFAAAAPLGHRDKAVDYCARAATRAAEQYANESAEALYRQAIELLGPDGDGGRWCDLAIGRGEALRRIGDPSHRAWLSEVADRARAMGDGERMARALITTYRGTFSRAMQVDSEYVQRLHSAVDLIGDQRTATRARLLALLGVETAWAIDHEANRRAMDEALSVARDLGDADLIATVLAQRQWTIFHPLSKRLADTEELAALGEHCADPVLRFDARGSEVFTRIRTGDRPGLDRAMERMRASAAEVRQPLVRWMLLIRESALALMEGRFEDAEAYLEEGREIGLATGQPDIQPQYIVQRFWLDVERQPLDLARSSAQNLARSYEKLPPLTAWSSIAFRTAELGLDESARPILESMMKQGFESIPMDQRWLVSLCGFSVATAALRERAAAERLYASLAPHAAEHANVVFATMGSVDRYLGLLCHCLGRRDEAERHTLRAIAANRAIGAVTWLARSQLDYVEERIVRAGFDAECRRVLDEAMSSAERFRLPTVLDRALAIAKSA